jgi:hypothetical protein
MRTNVNIADDARQFADLYAYANGLTLGDAITELIRKGREAEAATPKQIRFARSSSGFPVLPRRGRILTTEMVRKAEEEEDLV